MEEGEEALSTLVGERDVAAGDGRTLHVYDTGAPDGAPVLFHHGTPSSGRPYDAHVRLAAETGVRLVSWDRPGYGGSTRAPARAVADVVADALAVADALGIDRFATWGLSGGGPHALACAARGGGRVLAAASMAGVAPFDAEGLDWLAGMGEGNIKEFGLTVEGEDALRPFLEEEASGLEGVDDVGAFIQGMQPHLSDVDAAVLDGELGAYFLDGFHEALAPGVDGWLDDDLAFARPWGFDLSEIDVPVLVVQGRQDLMVPYAHGSWLAGAVPGAEPRLSESEGHLTLFANETARVLEWLVARS